MPVALLGRNEVVKWVVRSNRSKIQSSVMEKPEGQVTNGYLTGKIRQK
jgi:hypothetical protein